MKVIKVDQYNPDPLVVSEIADLLKAGAVIAFPTDTFYGIGADIANDAAVRRIYEIKGRMHKKPILILIPDRSWLTSLISNKKIPINASRLMDAFWPGPLTIVFYASKSISKLLTGYTGKIGIRLPDHKFCIKLIEKLERPITATSANISGAPSLSNPYDVMDAIGDRIDTLIDGGVTKGGCESTVVDVTGEELIVVREGAIPASDIKRAMTKE